MRIISSILSSGVILISTAAVAQDMLPRPGDPKGIEQPFSPYAGREFPTKVFWGDTHLHTAVSVDAGTMNTIGQEDAYRFARGEEITTVRRQSFLDS
mgnify:FL=1